MSPLRDVSATLRLPRRARGVSGDSLPRTAGFPMVACLQNHIGVITMWASPDTPIGSESP
jgi:hypothetical protein